MHDFDPADLDGDGEFDAIDIHIMEEGEKEDQSPQPGARGCCFLLAVLAGGVGAVVAGVRYFI
ncbi:MAG: hypothetical protein Kow0089_18860 [Desulfobulbaceae bacterium]